MRKHGIPLLVCGVFALLAGMWSTGSGLNPNMDSFWYFVYARSAAMGQGLTAPINSWTVPEVRLSLSQWPPLYPLFLSTGGTAVLPWAHLSSILLLILSALLIYGIGVSLLPESRIASVIAALLFLATPSVTQTAFSAAGSEALFVPLVLAATFCLTFFRSGQSAPWGMALLAALMLSLAVMTRYAGIGFVLMALVYLLRWARSVSGSQRWLMVAAMLIPLIPLALFALYLYQLTGSWTGMQPAAGALTLNDIPGLLRTVSLEMLSGLRWLFQQAGIDSNLPALAAGAVILVGLVFRLWQKRDATGKNSGEGRSVQTPPLTPRTAGSTRRPQAGKEMPSPSTGEDGGGSVPQLSNKKYVDTLWLLVLYIGGYTLSLWLLSVRSEAIFSGEPRHTVVLYPALWLLAVRLFQAADFPRWLTGVLFVCYLAGGVLAWEQSRAGLEYNIPAYRTLTAALTDLKAALPPDTLIHAEDAAYLSFYLGDAFPVRLFSADSVREGYACDRLIYPPGYSHALFVALDSPLVYDFTLADAEALLQTWALPCGTPHPLTETAGLMRSMRVDLK